MTSPLISCRSCGNKSITNLLDLGNQPLANNLLSQSQLNQEEPRFPLGLVVCEHCWMLQIPHLVPPQELFSHYLYYSSNSQTMLDHARTAAEKYIQEYGLDQRSLVCEVASNDGYFLKNFHQKGINCLGIEPAINIAEITQNMGIETILEFFDSSLAQRESLQGRQADIILGNNVFAHAPDTNDFVAALAIFLKPLGRIVLEFPYASDLIENIEFDTIYHEHVFYFSLTSLKPLFERHDLEIYDCERLSIHGGSLRIFCGHKRTHTINDSVDNLLHEEQTKGLSTLDYYQDFSELVINFKSQLTDLIDKLKSGGNTIAAYGASAKGSTLMNFVDLGLESIDFLVDKSSHKQGMFSPGKHIPIYPPDELLIRNPDYTLLLTWNFAEEILQQQEQYRKNGGKFILPLPELKIV